MRRRYRGATFGIPTIAVRRRKGEIREEQRWLAELEAKYDALYASGWRPEWASQD